MIALCLTGAACTGSDSGESQTRTTSETPTTEAIDPRVLACADVVTVAAIDYLGAIALGQPSPIGLGDGPEKDIFRAVILETLRRFPVYTGEGTEQVTAATPFVAESVLNRCRSAYPSSQTPVTAEPTRTEDTTATDPENSPSTTQCVGVSACAYDNGIDFAAVYEDIGSLVADEKAERVTDVTCDQQATPPNHVPPGGTITCEFMTDSAATGTATLTVAGTGEYDLALTTFVPFQPVD